MDEEDQLRDQEFQPLLDEIFHLLNMSDDPVRKAASIVVVLGGDPERVIRGTTGPEIVVSERPVQRPEELVPAENWSVRDHLQESQSTVISISGKPLIAVPEALVRIEQTIYRHLDEQAEQWRTDFSAAVARHPDSRVVFWEFVYQFELRLLRSIERSENEQFFSLAQNALDALTDAIVDHASGLHVVSRAIYEIRSYFDKYLGRRPDHAHYWKAYGFIYLSHAVESFIISQSGREAASFSKLAPTFDFTTYIEMAIIVIEKTSVLTYDEMAELVLHLLNQRKYSQGSPIDSLR